MIKNTSVTKLAGRCAWDAGVCWIHCTPSASLARMRVSVDVSQRRWDWRYRGSIRSILPHDGSANGSEKRRRTSNTFIIKASVATSRDRTCIAPRFAFRWQISPHNARTRSRGSAPARTSALKIWKLAFCTTCRDMRKELMLLSSSMGERDRASVKVSCAMDGYASEKHERRNSGPNNESRSMWAAVVSGWKDAKNGMAAASVLCSTAAARAI